MNDSLSKDISTIERYQKLHQVRSHSQKILQIFLKYRTENDILEELKNALSHKTDGYDLVDLLLKIKEPYQGQIINLFNLSPPLLESSPYRFKIMMDVDNTTVENKAVAPIVYRNGQLIPGLAPLLRYFSGGGRSTTTFLSARPDVMQTMSIRSLKKKIPKDLRFSILTGSTEPVLKYLNGKLYQDDEKVQDSYQMMAQEKYENFENLLKVYPHSQYIFMGDDTQGDPYFAYRLIQTRLQGSRVAKFAAIRIVSRNPLPQNILEDDRIIFHRSYYELAYELIKRGFSDLKDLVLEDFAKNYQEDKYLPVQSYYDHEYIRKIKDLS